jgi:hypothetical protein
MNGSERRSKCIRSMRFGCTDPSCIRKGCVRKRDGKVWVGETSSSSSELD